MGVEYFIGGTPLLADETKLANCHIAVGAPGRIKHLIEKNILNVENVRLFILDEADKLMEKGFQSTINWIYHKLPARKQVIAVSATYPDGLDTFLSNYMLSPMNISPDTKTPLLLGIRQFYSLVNFHLTTIEQMKYKTEELTRILSNISFNQCLVFSNYQTRAESLSNNLNQKGWPSRFITGQQDQFTRLQAIDDLRQFKCRILSSTDLTARGIDASNIDLVINYDVPVDVETYLHRMGRAGRYGSYGLCITIATEGKDIVNLQKIIKQLGNNVCITKLPETKLLKDIWQCDLSCLKQLCEENLGESDSSLNDILNKSPKEESTQLKNENISSDSTNVQIVNQAIFQLSELLSKTDNTAVSEDDVKCITSLLGGLKNKMEKEKTVVETDNSKLDNRTLLKKISEGKFSTKDSGVSTTMPENKKKKTEEPVIIPEQNSEVYNNEATNFQQNMLLRKNVALYAITKLMTEDKFCEIFVKDCAKDVRQLLDILKKEDALESNKYTSEVINSFLESHNIRNKERKDKKEKPHKNNKNNCDCPENLFTSAYDFSVTSEVSLNWRNVICNNHLNERENVNFAQEKKNSSEICSDDPDESFDDDTVSAVMEFEETTSKEVDYIEENIFSVAYDKAVEANIQNLDVSVEESMFSTVYDRAVEKNEQSLESAPVNIACNEPFGFTAQSSHSKKFVNFTRHSSEKGLAEKTVSEKNLSEGNSYVSSELQNFVERRNVYSAYYQHYSNVLRDTAPSFENVHDFRIWFAKWREEVEAVREFVQQDILKHECNKHKI